MNPPLLLSWRLHCDFDELPQLRASARIGGRPFELRITSNGFDPGLDLNPNGLGNGREYVPFYTVNLEHPHIYLGFHTQLATERRTLAEAAQAAIDLLADWHRVRGLPTDFAESLCHTGLEENFAQLCPVAGRPFPTRAPVVKKTGWG